MSRIKPLLGVNKKLTTASFEPSYIIDLLLEAHHLGMDVSGLMSGNGIVDVEPFCAEFTQRVQGALDCAIKDLVVAMMPELEKMGVRQEVEQVIGSCDQFNERLDLSCGFMQTDEKERGWLLRAGMADVLTINAIDADRAVLENAYSIQPYNRRLMGLGVVYEMSSLGWEIECLTIPDTITSVVALTDFIKEKTEMDDESILENYDMQPHQVEELAEKILIQTRIDSTPDLDCHPFTRFARLLVEQQEQIVNRLLGGKEAQYLDYNSHGGSPFYLVTDDEWSEDLQSGIAEGCGNYDVAPSPESIVAATVMFHFSVVSEFLLFMAWDK